jgi:hypothetical protein
MSRRIWLGAVVALLSTLALAPSAGAATPTQLLLSQGDAFAILGHSCGGIQEHAYATGFGADGYPTGEVYLKTSCGGSGRGGGYKTTTYTAWASVTWDWFGSTRSYGQLVGAPEVSSTFSAQDTYGDRVYNTATAAYLEAVAPPTHPPAAPTGVSAAVSLYEVGETESLRMVVSWTDDPQTAAVISSSTVTVTPVNPGPAVLTSAVAGTSATFQPVAPSTAYRITVTSTDAEGTSQPSAPLEIVTPNEDGVGGTGGGGAPPPAEACEQDTGTIKLTPGLTETPHVQEITVKGTLKGCDGPVEPTEGTYVAHLLTTEEVTCSTLVSLSAEPTTTSVSLAVKWLPLGTGRSHGSLVMALTEAGGAIEGTLEGGPFPQPQSIFAGSLWEAFTGAAKCGVPSPKGIVKPVKSGVFSTSALQIGT